LVDFGWFICFGSIWLVGWFLLVGCLVGWLVDWLVDFGCLVG
jgi:hypothetical protein